MSVIVVLGVSAMLQIASALLALRLVSVTGRKLAWGIGTCAMALMSVQRLFSLYLAIFTDAPLPGPAPVLLNLAISGLLLMGVGGAEILLRMFGAKPARHLEQEATLRALISEAPLAVFLIDPATRAIIDTNAAGERLTAKRRDDLIGMLFVDILASGDARRATAFLEEALGVEAGRDGRQSAELNMGSTSETTFPIELFSSVISHRNSRSLLLFVRDLSEKKHSQEAIRRSQELFDQLAEHIEAVFYVYDLQEQELKYLSPAYEKIWGRPLPGTLTETNPLRVGIQAGDEDLANALWECARNSCEVRVKEYRILRPSGQMRWVRERCFPIMDAHGAPRRLAGLAEDFTEQQLAKERLEIAERQMSAILHSISEVVTFHGCDLRIEWANQAARDRAQLSHEQIKGARCYTLWHNREEPCPDCPVQKVFESGTEQQLEINDAKNKVWSIRAYPVFGAQGEVMAAVQVAEDVTNAKSAEQKLKRYTVDLECMVEERTAELDKMYSQRQEMEKLAATGRIAAGVAHEINNPLAGIKNSFMLVREAVPRDHEYYRYVGLIEQEIERISRIILQMYQLYRPESHAPAPVLIGNIIEDVLVLLERPVCRKALTVKREIPEGMEPILLTDGYVRQIIYNLVSNAIDASPSGGVIRIDVRHTEQLLNITIEDEGEGIAENIRARIFEPFFTTKKDESHTGMGLGLSVSQSLAGAMGGAISFKRGTNQGTAFTLSLPACSLDS